MDTGEDLEPAIRLNNCPIQVSLWSHIYRERRLLDSPGKNPWGCNRGLTPLRLGHPAEELYENHLSEVNARVEAVRRHGLPMMMHLWALRHFLRH